MKLRPLMNGFGRDGEIIAQFGAAVLIRRSDGKWQLKGGSRDDRTRANEWISLFMHEVVLPAG